MPAIAVADLSKTYHQKPALAGVSLEIQPGELFCISGPDAAGRSTLLRIRADTLRPESYSTEESRNSVPNAVSPVFDLDIDGSKLAAWR